MLWWASKVANIEYEITDFVTIFCSARKYKMADYMRTMLDELMGPNRNQDQATTKHFDDPDVCKFFIHDFCPNDLFLNTRADLGMCRKLHDDRLRREYHLLSAHDKDRY